MRTNRALSRHVAASVTADTYTYVLLDEMEFGYAALLRLSPVRSR